MQKDKGLKLLSIFFLALILYNFPIISLFASEKQVLGIPSLFLYVFIVWFLLIILTIRIVERGNSRSNPNR